MGRLRAAVVWELKAPLHTTGDRVEVGLDKALALGYGGRPVLPATSVKGMLRDAASRALRALGADVCDPSQPSRCPGCRICSLFGSPRRKARLRFFEAVLEGGEEVWRAERTSVAISRRRGSALEERLFTVETAWAPTLRAQVEGRFRDRGEALEAAALLYLGARLVGAAGGGRSRGLGSLSFRGFEATWEGSPLPEEAFVQFLEGFRHGGV